MDVAALDSFTQDIQEHEAFWDQARDSHAFVPRRGVTSLNILNLPNEILTCIFEYCQGSWPQDPDSCYFSYRADDHGSYEYEVTSIEDIPLTCHRFCGASSHLLLSCLDVHLDASSLARLDQVSRHPTISKGIRALRVNVRYYSATIAENMGVFSSLAAAEFDIFMDDVDQEMASSSPIRPYDELVSSRVDYMEDGYMDEDDTNKFSNWAVETARRTANTWRQFAGDIETENDTLTPEHATYTLKHDEDIAAIKNTHAEYVELYAMQELVMRDGTFARAIADAMARMATAVRLSVTDAYSYREADRARRGHMTLVDYILEPEAFIRSSVIDKCHWASHQA